MSDTVACLTPPGQGALATLALTGPRAWAVARELFAPRTGSLPEVPEAGRFWLGQMAGDAVVLSVRQTGPALAVELHCHGGRAMVRLLIDSLRERGLAEIGWEEQVRRTANDPLQARAAAILARAPTARTAAIALDQYHGTLRKALLQVHAALDEGRAEDAQRFLRELLDRAPIGAHLETPWRVTLAGPPNVGKSSLLNALAGQQRSIVAPTPGTTRDVVTATLALGGWPVEVCDTAGLRDAGDALELEGVAQAQQAAASADLRLWVMDASSEIVPPPDDGVPTLAVLNKIDLATTQSPGALRVSAQTGQGVMELAETIARRLAPPPPPGAAVPLGDDLPPLLRRLLGGPSEEEKATLRALLGV